MLIMCKYKVKTVTRAEKALIILIMVVSAVVVVVVVFCFYLCYLLYILCTCMCELKLKVVSSCYLARLRPFVNHSELHNSSRIRHTYLSNQFLLFIGFTRSCALF